MDGRVLAPSVYRPSTFVDFDDSPGWWASLALWGALCITAGILANFGGGEVLALGGVAWFFSTAVLAGAERIEYATALGFSGLVWTSLGISLVSDTDPSRLATLIGFGVLGATVLAVGMAGWSRGRTRAQVILNPTP